MTNPNSNPESSPAGGGPHPEATLETSITVVQVGRRSRPPFLRQIEGPGSPRRIILNKTELVIGRDEKSDIALPSANVSRRHACLRCRQDEISIVDFDSRNGVFLNGIKVHSAVLRDGDIVQVADVVLEFYEG